MNEEKMGLIEKFETLLEDDRLSLEEVLNILESHYQKHANV